MQRSSLLSGSNAIRSLVYSPVFALLAPLAIAAPIVGGNETIDANDPIETWDLTQQATLTINGAETLEITADQSTLTINANSRTQQISATNGSRVDMDGARVTGAGGLAAVVLSNSTATIQNSILTSDQRGLQVVRNTSTTTGSDVVVSRSTVTGGTGGAVVTSFSSLSISDSTLEGTGATSFGLGLRGGQFSALGSTLIGGLNGVDISREANPQTAVLSIQDSTIQGRTGAAIRVNDNNVARISLNNASLLAGNNRLLDVGTATDVTFTVDNSALIGDVVTAQGGNTQLTLNASSLTGRLDNVASATINDGSQWVMRGDSQLGALALNGGTVAFGANDAFYQLNVGALSGNGRFLMGTDFTTGQTDVLNVTGTASGNHELLISSSGVDPAAGQPIRVVQTGGGDAQFSLQNGPVDLGTYSYALAKSGNDWILDPSTRTVSPSTRSVLALFNTAPTVWTGELTSLRTRMGELRFNGGKAGAWARAYGNKYNIDDASGVGYQQRQQGFSLGADAPLPIGDGQWLIGVLAGHSQSDLDLSRGTSGTVNSYYLGTYATWLDARSGYYFDAVIKANRFHNDAKVSLSDGARSKGDYHNHGLGGSLEFGRHISLEDGNFLEPFTQWSAVVIQGRDFSLDNDMRAEGDRTRSFLGKAGVTAGRNIALGGGRTVQPYVRLAWAHEFAKNNEVQVNDNVFNNDLSGSRGELGFGVAMAFNDRFHLHADFDYSSGHNFEQPFGVNLGMRYAW